MTLEDMSDQELVREWFAVNRRAVDLAMEMMDRDPDYAVFASLQNVIMSIYEAGSIGLSTSQYILAAIRPVMVQHVALCRDQLQQETARAN